MPNKTRTIEVQHPSQALPAEQGPLPVTSLKGRLAGRRNRAITIAEMDEAVAQVAADAMPRAPKPKRLSA